MKTIHIVLILFVAVLVGVLVGSFTTDTKSVDFQTAFANPEKDFRITGTLVREGRSKASELDQGSDDDELYGVKKAVEWDPNNNLTVFKMVDKSGDTLEVHYNQPPPANLERPGEISIVGRAKGEYFQASDVQIKCPSKYNEQSHLSEEATAS